MSGTTDRYNDFNFMNLLLHGMSSDVLMFNQLALFGRKVTITGSQRAIRAAESMIMQKVAYASERVMD